MKRQSWPLVAFAFAALLAVVGLSALEVGRQTRKLRDNIAVTELQALERESALRAIRENTDAIAIAVRDLLLEAGPADSSIARFATLHAQLTLGLTHLQNPKDADQAEHFRQLRSLLDQYWRTAAVPATWSAAQRRARGAAFLRDTLVPLRNSALAVAKTIETIEDTVLLDRRQRIDGSFARLERTLERTLAITLAAGLLIAALTVWRFARLERQTRALHRQTHLDREQLRVLSQRLLRAHEDERKSLSRELHDQIGQMLTAIQMVFGNIELGRGDPHRLIEDGRHLTERTVAAVRGISMGLRPSILDDLGLGPAIEWQAREFSKRSGIPVDLHTDGHLESLSDAQKTCLYRIVQESLTNCARHSNAAGVRVSLHAGSQTVSLLIEDDGQGFHPASVSAPGLGLIGMRERVRELGGTLSILSQPGKGALVKIELPSIAPSATQVQS